MQRRTFNQLLARSLVSVVPAAAQELARHQPSSHGMGAAKWFDKLTPGIHLDYHYPEWDSHLLSKADGRAMMQQVAAAGARIVVVFAKCHYGNCYYNTRAGHKHRNLGNRDLFREWVSASRRLKMTTLAYYSVDRDAWAGKQHPEWRMKDAQGNLIDEDRWPPEWAAMGFLCYNSGYRELVKAQVEEILDYDIDGFHFDMLWFGHTGKVCHCHEYCQPLFRSKYHIDMPAEAGWDDDWRKFLEFRYESNAGFADELTALIHRKRPDLSVVYNYHGAPPNSWQEGMLPVRHRQISDYGTGEGYPPRFGHRYASLLSCFLAGLQPGSPWQGVTSRYSRTINDHTVRPLADMQWETFTYLSHGGMPLFVDTPDDDGGTLDPVAYSRMARIFSEINRKTEYLGHERVHQVGLYFSAKTRDWYGRDEPMRYLRGIIGAHRILTECHIPVSFLFDENLTWEHLREFPVVYLPNTAILSPTEQDLFRHFVSNGGNLLATLETSRFDPNGNEFEDFALADLLGVRYTAKTEFAGNYFRVPTGFLSSGLPAEWDVFLEGPNNVVLTRGAETFGELKLAFHDRGLTTHVGHAPHNSAWKTISPAVFLRKTGAGRAVYLPFSPENAYMGNYPLPEHRWLVRNIVRELLPDPQVTIEAPLHVEAIVTIDRAKSHYVIHFVQFTAVPDAQSQSGVTTLIPTMEEAGKYVARIKTSFVVRQVSVLGSNSRAARRGEFIELDTSEIHESLVISY